ncbi:MAG: hypothetical protein FWF43_01865 [Propionibacteriaceae bacterium]|nr:hypothetical protein [Propionibacteriaceae bacterium]
MVHHDIVPAVAYARIDFDGRLNMDRLINAVAKAAIIIPEILCGIDTRHFRFKPVGITPADIVEEVAYTPEACPAFDPRSGPQTKILVGHGPQADTLVVQMSHVMSDGAGLWQFVGLLAACYNGRLVHARNNRSAREALSGQKVGPATAAEHDGEDTAWDGFPMPGSVGDRLWLVETIPAETLTLLHDKARQSGVTLNDVFLAAYSRIVCSLMQTNKSRVSCPADLRRFTDLGELTVANLTGRYMVTVRVEPGDSFSTTVSRIHDEVQELRRRNRQIAQLHLLHFAWRFAPKRLIQESVRGVYHLHPISYSNMGVLNPSSATFGTCKPLRAAVFGPYIDTGGFLVVISTMNGVATLGSSIVADPDRAQAGQEILKLVVGQCTAWLAEPAQG